MALACLFFYSASNAQQTTTNPFAGSQYTDLEDLADLLIQEGFSIDNYFYSEGFSTGSDGSLGNEHICIRDDTRQVYIGRSDVCVDRAEDESYAYIQIDKMDWSMGFPQEVILQSGDLIGDAPSYWDGCYQVAPSPSWGGTQGGQCPNINSQTNQINFGYVEQTLTNISAINHALIEAGVEITGYTYSWIVKNADANMETENNPNSVDPFEVTIKIVDSNNNVVFEKTYDYSYWIDNWTRMSGTETFADPFDATEISELQLSVTAYDIGYWAGWYGPEFNEANVKLNFRYTREDDTIEQLLFEQRCTTDPLSDPLCPEYNDAMIAQINESTATTPQDNTGTFETVDTSNGGFDDGISDTETTNIIADTTGAIIDDGADTGSDNGAPDPVAEATGEPDPVAETIEEAVAEATPDPVQEAVEEATEEAVAEADATKDPASASTGLNATQLSALDAANNVANSAVAAATGTAQASAGIGLSESGGVSSTLTSVDPTGSTRTDGGVLGGTDFEFSSDVAASDPTQSTETTQTAGINNNQSFGSTQTNTSQSVSGSDDGSSQGTQSNNGSSNNFGTTDLASLGGANTQGSNPLANGSAVETNDITGEQALSTSNEAIEQLAMLNDPTNPINQIINDVAKTLITQAASDAEEVAEESAEASVESQNAKEDALVAEALAGSDDEDAQAALLGYNPNFRAYQQPQMPGGDIYNDQGVYENQKTYDNPRAGLFNGASDQLHRDMVRQQYEK